MRSLLMGGLVLLGLIPVGIYTVSGNPYVGMSLVSVVIIGGSLYVMMSGSTGEAAGDVG
jgi:hypothetical protein